MWLLGAGASAAAGIPTAADMIWEFKQRLFVTQRKVSFQRVADLSNPNVRSQLQGFIDSAADMPAPGSEDEYAHLFERVYPAEADRRAYIDSKIAGAKPSYGHLALATLMRAGATKVVWTTNFDPLVADACAKVYDGTGFLTTASPEAPEQGCHAILEGRWPVEVKLHGDFRSRQLKNTSGELRLQDENLRRILVDSCKRFGLIVAGYSGRDASVMDALLEASNGPNGYPAGLFWLHRGDGEPAIRVANLLRNAAEAGTEAALVRIENFDETLRDLTRQQPNLDTTELEKFGLQRRRWSPAPAPRRDGQWPVLRLNALPILDQPSVCRILNCSVGGLSEARAAAEAAGVDILVARTRAGVLGFGKDADMRAAFKPFGVTEFALHSIQTKKLRYDSGERGLLREALSRALSNSAGLELRTRRTADLLFPKDPSAPKWNGLLQSVGSLGGSVPNIPDLTWYEGIGVRLDWADDRMWLLFEPRIVFEGITPENKAAAADFGREKTVKRYNRELNKLLAFWAKTLSSSDASISALQISEGVDASFRIGVHTAYSWRANA